MERAVRKRVAKINSVRRERSGMPLWIKSLLLFVLLFSFDDDDEMERDDGFSDLFEEFDDDGDDVLRE